MPFELSWIPGGSVGFLIDLFGFFELTMVVVRGRGCCHNELCSSRVKWDKDLTPGRPLSCHFECSEDTRVTKASLRSISTT